MTTFLALQSSTPFPQSPSFLSVPPDPAAQVAKVVKAIMKAKRVIVICGAGISVKAGIPDFRSPDGLFHSMKRDNPKESLASGKDLFDASVFNSEQSTALFCQMIAGLSKLSTIAQPTAFHQMLRALDERGRLLRVYTQNIDALEMKAGLSFGVPNFVTKPRSKSKTPAAGSEAEPLSPGLSDQLGSRLPSPEAGTPRCIPLHGTLQMMHCQTCTHSFPLKDYLPLLASGTLPKCPECTSMERTRQLIGKRARGVGKLRPSVVLYNETHKDGEWVGEVVKRDLIGSSKGKGRSGADLLLVVGTSLRVPGTKRMVREFAKAVHSRNTTSQSTPASPPRRSPAADDEPPIKSVYLNLDFPVPTREWEGVFDVWLQGDAQKFAEILLETIRKEAESKKLAIERKRKREEDAILRSQCPLDVEVNAQPFKRHKTSKMKRAKTVTQPTSKRRKLSGESNKSTEKRARKLTASKPPDRTGIILRIPARRVPEVYITIPPRLPSPPPTRKKVGRKTDPRRVRRRNTDPSSSLTGQRRATTKRAKSKSSRYSARPHFPSPPSSTSTSSEEDEAVDVGGPELTHSFVRNIQYGLRGS